MPPVFPHREHLASFLFSTSTSKMKLTRPPFNMLDEFIFPISSISFVSWHVERKGWSVGNCIPQAMVVTSMRHSVFRDLKVNVKLNFRWDFYGFLPEWYLLFPNMGCFFGMVNKVVNMIDEICVWFCDICLLSKCWGAWNCSSMEYIWANRYQPVMIFLLHTIFFISGWSFVRVLDHILCLQ